MTKLKYQYLENFDCRVSSIGKRHLRNILAIENTKKIRNYNLFKANLNHIYQIIKILKFLIL